MKTSSRDRLRDHCVAFYSLVHQRRNISLGEIAEEMGVSRSTARRWAIAFSRHLDLRIEHGIVVLTDKEEKRDAGRDCVESCG